MANRKENDELLAKVFASHDPTMQELNFINTVFGFLNRNTKYLQQSNAGAQIQGIVNKHIEKAKQKKSKKGKKNKNKNKNKNQSKSNSKTIVTKDDQKDWTNTQKKDASTTASSESVGVGTDSIPIDLGNSNSSKKTEGKEDSDNEDDGEKLEGNGGRTDKYVWTQTLEEVEMKIDVPKSSTAKDCDVQIEDRHLKVKLKGETEYIVNGELHDAIDSDDCTWTLDEEYGKDGKTLTLFLSKQKGMNWWNRVIVGDAEIDTKKIEPANSKLDDLEPDVRQTVEKMMHDQRAKMAGKPTSKELEQQQILAKFKSQHPEMDFSNVKFG